MKLLKFSTLWCLIFARTNFRDAEYFSFRDDLFSQVVYIEIFREG